MLKKNNINMSHIKFQKWKKNGTTTKEEDWKEERNLQLGLDATRWRQYWGKKKVLRDFD